MGKFKDILAQLPYTNPFLFVDDLLLVHANGAKGSYTFKKDEYFYKGHFVGNPITPGVILTECMAQIGVVSLGIYLIDGLEDDDNIALTENEVHFYKPVFPGETVTVISKKEYFRFGKLKCKVEMRNQKDELVCRGSISGMIFKSKK